MAEKMMRRVLIVTSMLAVLMACMTAEGFAGVKVEKDKEFENLFYVDSGGNFRAKCVIDEISMPYYEATIVVDDASKLAGEIAKQKKAGKKWLTKNSKKKHTYKITFKQYDSRRKKWRNLPSYTIKKQYKRKFKYDVTKKGDVKAVVCVELAYTGTDEKYFATKKFKKNIKYVENSADNEAFYFTANGKFHWEPGEDDDE